MEITTSLVIVLYNMAISLGVGASSIVIASFIVALWDKAISQDERSLLGVIYVTLRIAMVAILITVGYLTVVYPDFSTILPQLWVLIAVLYGNAVLMTLHWIPSKLGPPLQAATWYTLGTVVAVDLFNLYSVSWSNFTLLYAGFTVFWVAVVNLFMYFLFRN